MCSYDKLQVDPCQEQHSENAEEDANLDSAIAEARKELQALRDRSAQEKLRRDRQDELVKVQQELDKATRRLSSRFNKQSSSQAKYMAETKESYRRATESQNAPGYDGGLPPVYVMRYQASLVSAMHNGFQIYPHQTDLIEEHHNHMCDYLHATMDKLQWERDQVAQAVIDQVSVVAQENHDCYDRYQQELEAVQAETRQLLQEPNESAPEFVDKLTYGISETEYDEDTIDSTCHSSLGDGMDDDDSSFHLRDSISKLQGSFSNAWNSSVIGNLTEQWVSTIPTIGS